MWDYISFLLLYLLIITYYYLFGFCLFIYLFIIYWVGFNHDHVGLCTFILMYYPWSTQVSLFPGLFVWRFAGGTWLVLGPSVMAVIADGGPDAWIYVTRFIWYLMGI